MMNLLYVALSACFVCALGTSSHWSSVPLYGVHKWKKLAFHFPSNKLRNKALANGNWRPNNPIPMDIQPVYSEFGRRMFVTIPRLTTGIPYSLAVVMHTYNENGPLLKPYPNYKVHNNKNGNNCNRITSAFRMAVNECNQMWVIDSGVVGTNAQCPPQLLLFDLKTDRLLHRYRFNSSLYTHGSLFVTPVLNVKDPSPEGTCRQTMVYVADAHNPGLVVYDYANKNAWRIENLFMHPSPETSLLSVANETFVSNEGIYGMATSRKKLYMHPLNSLNEFAIPLNELDDINLFQNSVDGMATRFVPLGERASPCTVSAMDRNNNLYCVTTDPISLTVWNVHTPFYSLDVVASPTISKFFQFVSGMKIVINRDGKEELWMMANKYQKSAARTRNFNEDNFKIYKMYLPNVRVSSF